MCGDIFFLDGVVQGGGECEDHKHGGDEEDGLELRFCHKILLGVRVDSDELIL